MAHSKKRCGWALGNTLRERYHDEEWGVPVHNERRLFEFLILEGAQAGLSWDTILKKRGNYRKVFKNFDPIKVATFTKRDVARLIQDEGIVRNRLKIESTISNAKALLETKREFGSFDTYIWQFVGRKTIENNFKHITDIPANTKESDRMSKDLKRRGFRFVGTTICYAFMQAVGMVNDHEISCFRYQALKRTS